MPIFSILFSLAITLFIETGIYMILKHSDIKFLLVVSLMNLILNPTMNILFSLLIPDEKTYWVALVIAEVSTVLIESLIVFLFMRFKYLITLLFSAIANGSSLAIGLLLRPVYETKTTIIVLMSLFFLGYLFIYVFVLVSFMHRNNNDRDSDNSADQQNNSNN